MNLRVRQTADKLQIRKINLIILTIEVLLSNSRHCTLKHEGKFPENRNYTTNMWGFNRNLVFCVSGETRSYVYLRDGKCLSGPENHVVPPL